MRKWIPPAIFVLLGFLLIPYGGFDADEVFFANALFGPSNHDYSVTVFHHALPLMIFPYAGSLKALLYWPVLHAFTANPYSVRLPVVLAGAAAILLFFLFAERLAGSRAALIAAFLLATDPSLLLTDTYDWGPVALQHLLVAAGCLLIIRRRHAWGFFCFGLALWNKSIVVWAFAGLAAGAMAAYGPEVRAFFSDRRILARCGIALLAGALPLIVFNLHHPNATMQSNIHFSTGDFAIKLVSLRTTLDGSALFGIITAPQSSPDVKQQTASIHGRIDAWISDHGGARYSTLSVYAILLALLLTPVWWRSPLHRRAALFAIVFVAVAFLSMAMLRFTGAAHHIVLLYPMPQLFVGAALAALTSRRLAFGIATVLIAANLLVVNQYFTELERYGAGRMFTDALYPLSAALPDSSTQTIYVVDWGIAEGLNILHRRELKIAPRLWAVTGADPLPPAKFEPVFADPNGILLIHTPPFELYPGMDAQLDNAAASLGYRKRIIRTISDSNGRPTFELLRFERQ